MLDSERFWAKVDRSAGPSGCWPWSNYISRNGEGYGRFYHDGTGTLAHVYAWSLHHGRTPREGCVVMHSCDFGACCNPAHLSEGTQADNVKDMVEKGRQRTIPLYGEANPMAKLTEDQVVAIRTARAEGESVGNLAKRYGIARSHIWNIGNGNARQNASCLLVFQKGK